MHTEHCTHVQCILKDPQGQQVSSSPVYMYGEYFYIEIHTYMYMYMYMCMYMSTYAVHNEKGLQIKL